MRDTVTYRATSGERRIFIQRRSLTRTGSDYESLAETPEFLAFLKDHRFEIVDFGGRNPRRAAGCMLDGARVI